MCMYLVCGSEDGEDEDDDGGEEVHVEYGCRDLLEY